METLIKNISKRLTKEYKDKLTRIKQLKAVLAENDYKIIKCYEYQLVGSEIPYDIEKLHLSRERIREAINVLEAEKEALNG